MEGAIVENVLSILVYSRRLSVGEFYSEKEILH